MDLMDDDVEAHVRRTARMKRWDRRKKRYVGMDTSGDKGKKITFRNESGQLVTVNTLEKSDLYENWKRKHNKTINAVIGACILLFVLRLVKR